MIFLLAGASALILWRFALDARRRGIFPGLRDLLLAAVSGLLAGVLVGMGARVGMSAVTLANGDAPQWTIAGTVAVVTTFAGFGGVGGIIYAGLVRRLLRRSGTAYGLLLTLCSWYSLADAGLQQVRSAPSLFSIIFVSGLVVILIWLPYAILLEKLVSLWQHQATAPSLVDRTV